MSATLTDAPPRHRLDDVSFGKIVQIRETLLRSAATGKRVIRFESGDPSFSVAPHVLDAIEKAGRAGKTHYIPNDGIPELRKALAEKVRDKNKLADIKADDIYVTNGAMHALYVAFGSLLLPGEEVIIPDPMWTEVAENIKLAGGVPRRIPVRAENDYGYDPEAIERAITPATRAIFLNTPHNPTGAVLPVETLKAIVELAKANNLWIVSDEAYEDILYEPYTHTSIGSLAGDYADKVISIYSFSKSHAMAGLRTGYIVTRSAQLQERIQKLLRCTINGVNSLAQWGALAAVTGDQSHLAEMRKEYKVRRDLLLEALSDIPGLRAFTPGGAFYVWAELAPSVFRRLDVYDAAELSDKLAEAGIGSAPGDAFGEACANGIRFAYSCSTEMVREGAPLLRAALLGESK